MQFGLPLEGVDTVKLMTDIRCETFWRLRTWVNCCWSFFVCNTLTIFDRCRYNCKGGFLGGFCINIDTLVTKKQDSNLNITVYRKPIRTHRYLHFNFYHSTHVRIGLVRYLYDRAMQEHHHLPEVSTKRKRPPGWCTQVEWIPGCVHSHLFLSLFHGRLMLPRKHNQRTPTSPYL